MRSLPPNLHRALDSLKDFQRRTVDYVFQRMYLEDPPALRFLVADEVGLGKTLVARGIIAKALERLHHQGIDRIDVVYICSNAAIAQQNINRLNVTGDTHLEMATRLTLLPMQLARLESRHINFVSFTPGTTFDLRSRGGIVAERALIFRILREHLPVRQHSFLNLLQATAGRKNWRNAARNWDLPIDRSLADRFVARVVQNAELMKELSEACERFRDMRRRLSNEDNQSRYHVIGRLRQTLAEVCIHALEPDLVILDEFQRFKDLLDGEDDAAILARTLFQYEDVRVLLLSATPYRMLTLDHEEDDDHYKDFLRTLEFLFPEQQHVREVESELKAFRSAIHAWSLEASAPGDLQRCRDSIQRKLHSVMVRTERVPETVERDAMVREPFVRTRLMGRDLKHARLIDRVSQLLGTHDSIEYWKSGPFTLSFMRNYKLREKLDKVKDEPPDELLRTLLESRKLLFNQRAIELYRKLDPANARMRALFRETVKRGLWKLLWIPPSLPYFAPTGPFEGLDGVTKSLVFSSWNLVPDAISSLLSYEAERRMLAHLGEKPGYKELHRKIPHRLRFHVDRADNRLGGMTTLALLYPSITLAERIDPLRIAASLAASTQLPDVESARVIAKARIAEALNESGVHLDGLQETGRHDSEWYWSSLAFLDGRFHRRSSDWCLDGEGWMSTTSVRGTQDAAEASTGFVEHVQEFASRFDRRPTPDSPLPDDLLDVLADLALGSPTICALRALHRLAPQLSWESLALRNAAARVGDSFRTLFNLPESIAYLDSGSENAPYWRSVLRYCLAGNLQAVLDEFVHNLRESLGLFDHPPEEIVSEVATAVSEALSIRSTRLDVDEIRVHPLSPRIKIPKFGMRCRFALRFGEIRDPDGRSVARIGTVRQAFNSPFRPFVLATTSIGQEGLDFHTYCHSIYHWNLPSNPVDLEQREGRVHRYKGHAVRKNVAARFGLQAFANGWKGGDPWDHLFELAKAGRDASASDLVPFWIYETEGGAKVERRVPALPLSRDASQLKRLKRSLAVYRLVFGQPRQEDLLAYLERGVRDGTGGAADLDQWRISLAPPGGPGRPDGS